MLLGLLVSALLQAGPVASAPPVSPEAGPAPTGMLIPPRAGVVTGTVASTPADGPLFASPTRLDRIGRILVPVMINGKGPFRLVVDTGASLSTVSPQLATELGLTPAQEAPIVVNGITGSAQLPTVPIALLQAGGLVAENLRLPVVWAPLMAGADGILGAAGLTRERLLVDFQHDRVVINHSHGQTAIADFQKVPARRLASGLLSVTGRVGRVRVQAIIDTGSERTLGNLMLADALHARGNPGRAALETTVYGATSATAPGEVELAPPISLGDVVVTQVPVVFGDFHIFEVWDLTHTPAVIIGMDVLGTVSELAIDFEQSELYVRSIQAGGPVISKHPAFVSGRLGR